MCSEPNDDSFIHCRILNFEAFDIFILYSKPNNSFIHCPDLNVEAFLDVEANAYELPSQAGTRIMHIPVGQSVMFLVAKQPQAPVQQRPVVRHDHGCPNLAIAVQSHRKKFSGKRKKYHL